MERQSGAPASLTSRYMASGYNADEGIFPELAQLVCRSSKPRCALEFRGFESSVGRLRTQTIACRVRDSRRSDPRFLAHRSDRSKEDEQGCAGMVVLAIRRYRWTVSVRRTHIDSYRLLTAHTVGVSSGSLWMDKLASPGRSEEHTSELQSLRHI